MLEIYFNLILRIYFSLVLGIFNTGFFIQAEVSNEWIIIPDKVSLYEKPDLLKKTSIEIPGYPKTVIDISELESPKAYSGTQWIKILYGQDYYFLPETLLLKKVLWLESEGNLIIGEERIDRWNPLPFNYKPNDLIKLPQKWNYHTQEYPKYLRAGTAQILVEMLSAAEKQNIHIRVVSAFRSALDQRRLYLRKLNQAGLDQMLVAKPGHSEHQLGTTVDLCGLDPDYILKPEFERTKEGMWLQENAVHYGFIQSYSEKNSKDTGYSSEPWHYRYMGKEISN